MKILKLPQASADFFSHLSQKGKHMKEEILQCLTKRYTPQAAAEQPCFHWKQDILLKN